MNDDQRLETCLAVLMEASDWDPDDPRVVSIERAADRLFKGVKKRRRAARRAQRAAADRAILAETSIHTGAPDPEQVALGATLHKPHRCYACHASYVRVHSFYHRLCPVCAERSWAARQRRLDLRGRRALVTGGCVKIGHALALTLLRDGAHVEVTTRFPRDAARRFAAQPDADEWSDRLTVHGVDFRDVAALMALCDRVRQGGGLDLLVNNAAQTIRRTRSHYAPLLAAEAEPLDPDAHALLAAPERATALAPLPAGALSLPHIPEDGYPNSWRLQLEEIAPVEAAEAWVVTAFSPFLLCHQLKSALLAGPHPGGVVVNVAASEGQFDHGAKTTHHPHVNMAKAALNMLTRTSAEAWAAEGIYMSSVDPGWISDENDTVERPENWRPPLDAQDATARILDPLARALDGDPVFGVLLKDFDVCSW